MTTHYVDIRLKSAGIAAPWEALTHDPIPLKDAKGLQAHIGERWESRVRAAVTAEDFPTILERLDLITDVPRLLLAGAMDRPAFIEEDTVADLIRSGVFSVFERYRGELALERWRPTNNVPKHKRGCKRSKVSAEVRPQGAADSPVAEHWKILTELDARVAHVNSVTIPGLGIVAAMTMENPKLHTATCKSCGAVSHATSIALEVTWREHHLRREYEI